MIKALIFDLDGTLLNTVTDLQNSVNYVLSALDYPQKNMAEIKSYLGNGVENLIKKSLPAAVPEEVLDNALSLFKSHYSQNMNNQTAPYQGITELLTSLKKKGYKLAIVSNKYDEAVKELNEKFFKEYMDAAEGESSTARKKPAPDMVLKILQDFNITEKEAIYIGDSEVDIQTAKNAGLPFISVTWGFRTKEALTEAGAVKFADTPSDILKIIEAA